MKTRTEGSINTVFSTVISKDYRTNVSSFLFWKSKHTQDVRTALLPACVNCPWVNICLEWVWTPWIMCINNIDTQGILQNQLQGKDD